MSTGSPAIGTEGDDRRWGALRVFTTLEAHRFVEAADRERCSTLIRLLVWTGLTLGEALGLDWRDVDLDRGTARISGAYRIGRKRKMPALVRRTIHLPSRLVAILRVREERGELVFHDEVAELTRARSVRRLFRRISRCAGTPPASPWLLRHTWATQMLERGVPLNYVSRGLGHQSVAQTARVYRRELAIRDALPVSEGHTLESAENG